MTAFVDDYPKLSNSLELDEAVVRVEAVHPTHAARATGLWPTSAKRLAIAQGFGRQRLNIRNAIDLETGKTAVIENETADSPIWRL